MASAQSSSDEQSPVENARDELQESVPKAAETLCDLLEAEDERIQIRAAETILDRAGLTKAKQSSNTRAKEEVGGATKDSPLDDLL